MKSSDIFLEAARLIESGECVLGCCDAIRDVVDRGPKRYVPNAISFFAALFEPATHSLYWWPLWERDSRVIALCWAAAVSRDEEDGK